MDVGGKHDVVRDHDGMKPVRLAVLHQRVDIVRRGGLTARWEIKAIMHGMPFWRAGSIA